ncbi:MAG: amino acid aldolase or racemase [Dehalococcoidia bacterium]|nr:amino acid aldolase or racemase [Dehalococcoidia bacterium]
MTTQADLIGQPVEELDTPALLVDLDVMEGNIRRMAAYFAEHGVSWRPHTKGVKVPEFAQQELAAGAIGVTCAKLGDAEAMAAGGVDNILIANQIVGQRKLERLVALVHGGTTVIVAIDSADHALALDAAAQAAGVQLNVVVELNVGMDRSGVLPREPAVALARQVHELPGLTLRGLMGWEGHAADILDPAAKRQAIEAAIGTLVATAERCRAAGLPCEIVSCGGTHTYQITATLPGITEVQAGGGIFCDMEYSRWVDHPIGLSLLASVVSRPDPQRIIVDSGFKALGRPMTDPCPRDLDGVTSIGLSAEHGTIGLDAPNDAVRIGDKIEIYAGYGDMTVFLHDELYGVRNGQVEAIWPVFPRRSFR